MRTNWIRRIGTTAVAALLVVSMAGCPATTIVVINDEVLDAAIRSALGQPLGFLTRADLLTLHSLDARDLNIRNLSGLEYCTNLTFLDLSGNPISDITPLATLVNLQSLNLDGTDVYDIAALAGLQNLDSVSLCGSLITDIQALVTNSVNGGLGPGDFVNVTCGALGDQAETFDIPFLEGEGVNVVCCDDSEGEA
ncbi:MAG: leucine-rich repeat domain-containing protein [Candidatus Hydrogenedentes bacterium]|nr:leucine-rich repeat domain-containing protein [Candidatus Hydrogenedentota bacterium]